MEGHRTSRSSTSTAAAEAHDSSPEIYNLLMPFSLMELEVLELNLAYSSNKLYR
jgi:hypothetical protein